MVGGIFFLVDSEGIPLDLVVDRLNDQGFMCDWLDFWRDAMKQGWKPDRTYLRLQSVVGEVYGPAFREGWEQSMSLLLEAREEPHEAEADRRDDHEPGAPSEVPGGHQEPQDAPEQEGGHE